MATTVEAAGGVLWRPTADGPEVCLVHRPRYGDWSLPKGKLEPGEHPLVGAVREVWEETGVRGRPQSRLPLVAYRLPDGRTKTVDFWVLRAVDDPGPTDGGPTDPGPADPDEVDAVRWLPVLKAAALVSYPDDARLLERVAAMPPVTAVLPLVRHGHAGRRGAFEGPDTARPLDARGRREAGRLAEVLALFAPRRLYAATPLRCRQTLQPLAERVGLAVEADPAFDEPAAPAELPDRVAAASARIAHLLDGGLLDGGQLDGGKPDGGQAVVCSQGKLMPGLLATLAGVCDPEPYRTPKGTGWLLCYSGTRLATLDRL